MNLNFKEFKRFEKQIILKKIGFSGQKKIKKAKILIVGLGGLGCPLVSYLAASGIGNICIVDHDKVELGNLNRQILFNNGDLNKYKVLQAKKKVAQIYKNIKIKFEGKGYYLYKNIRNTLAPKFGFAHRLYLYHFKSWIKILSKTKLLFYNNDILHCLSNANQVRLLRPRNPFTGRGVRFGRSIRFKKKGKVSSFK